jgi:hypothetical protein
MRRKNWSKTLKKTYLFDRRLRRSISDIRRLRLQRILHLFKKNLIIDYIFFKFFLVQIYKLNKLYVHRFLYKNELKSIIINPIFLYEKQVFLKRNNFLDFLIENNYKSFNLFKFKNNNFYGYNYCVFNIFNKRVSLDKFTNILDNEKYNNIVTYKNFGFSIFEDKVIFLETLNFFIN